jgi:hypothetical protein
MTPDAASGPPEGGNEVSVIKERGEWEARQGLRPNGPSSPREWRL